jgi:RimJ/RimL family protein N-acetyltransferase
MCRLANISDAEFFWHCWNDPLTQRMMKSGGPVPWSDHLRWFTNEISKAGATLFVMGAQQDGVGIGVVRFIKQAEKLFDVSLIIAPAFRGRGYASTLVAASIMCFRENRGPATLFAGFKKVNIPSQRAFLAAGFTLCDISVLPVTPKTELFDPETELMSIRRVD